MKICLKQGRVSQNCFLNAFSGNERSILWVARLIQSGKGDREAHTEQQTADHIQHMVLMDQQHRSTDGGRLSAVP